LDVVFGERYPWRNAVDDAPNAGTVALAERVHAEVLPKRTHECWRRRHGDSWVADYEEGLLSMAPSTDGSEGILDMAIV
jgi:hypothetical protein